MVLRDRVALAQLPGEARTVVAARAAAQDRLRVVVLAHRRKGHMPLLPQARLFWVAQEAFTWKPSTRPWKRGAVRLDARRRCPDFSQVSTHSRFPLLRLSERAR